MPVRFCAGALILVLSLVGGAAAQVNTAAVNGSVTDESRAVLPGVTITATDKETGRKYVATSDERGVYQLALLPPGVYGLQADLAGFSPASVPTFSQTLPPAPPPVPWLSPDLPSAEIRPSTVRVPVTFNWIAPPPEPPR